MVLWEVTTGDVVWISALKPLCPLRTGMGHCANRAFKIKKLLALNCNPTEELKSDPFLPNWPVARLHKNTPAIVAESFPFQHFPGKTVFGFPNIEC